MAKQSKYHEMLEILCQRNTEIEKQDFQWELLAQIKAKQKKVLLNQKFFLQTDDDKMDSAFFESSPQMSSS